MKKGFTLIELLVVIAMIGILASAFLTVVNPINQIRKASDSQRKSDLAQIQRALESFYQDFGFYPQNTVDYRIDANPVEGTGGNIAPVAWGSAWNPYLDVLPKDPASSKWYLYVAGSGGQNYRLYASLDRGAQDPSVCNAGNACSGVPTNTLCGGTGSICNYGVSSPNVSP